MADIAIKAVTQNNHLVPEDVLPPTNGALPEVLVRPRVSCSLTSWTFIFTHAGSAGSPAISNRRFRKFSLCAHPLAPGDRRSRRRRKFVCSTTQPVAARRSVVWARLERDSRRYHGGDARNPIGERAIEAVEEALDEGNLASAREELEYLKQLQHGDTRDTARLEATINNLEVLAHEAD